MKNKSSILILLVILLTIVFVYNENSKAMAGMPEISENEVMLLASFINAESGNEKYLGQVAVGAIIMNRVKNPEFPNTIVNVIYQSGAFPVVKKDILSQIPPDECISAALDAISGWDPSNGALYYWNYKDTTDKSVTIVIGDYAFGYK